MGKILNEKKTKYPRINNNCNNDCYKDVNTGNYALKCFECEIKDDQYIKNTLINIKVEKFNKIQSRAYRKSKKKAV